MSDPPITTQLALAGHDSELFSFLDAGNVRSLKQHLAARIPLWTLGQVADGQLMSCPQWNCHPAGFAWTKRPLITTDESGFRNFRGFVTRDPLIRVEALILVRYLFVQGYSCALDDRVWMADRPDPGLQRLPFIRGWNGADRNSAEWQGMMIDFWGWAMEALNRVKAAVGVVPGQPSSGGSRD